MSELFIVGEWVKRRKDQTAGVVRKIEHYYDEILYHVVLQSPGVLVVIGSEAEWERYHHVHAHVLTASRDCDGDYTQGYTAQLTAEERCSSFGDVDFKQRVISDVVTVYGHGTLDVTPDRAVWEESTEDGLLSRRTDMEWCELACDVGLRKWFRDIQAEKAGY